MDSNVTIIFGAGATKACGGPLTKEILSEVFKEKNTIEREGYISLLQEFLVENFHVSASGTLNESDFPALPLLLSLIDTAIDRKHAFGANWQTERLSRVRSALEYAIFALLELKLQRLTANYYRQLFERLYGSDNSMPNAISLNYDIIVDNAILSFAESVGLAECFPFYGCDISTDFYRGKNHFGNLFKIHGSLNWLYCPGCNRLDLGISESGRRTVKVLNSLYIERSLEEHYSCQGIPCRDCSSNLMPVLITPTHLKDYRNPHISQVWYNAEKTLRKSQRVIIIGYSLPEDDVDVIYLLKRGLAHLSAENITVVEYDNNQRDISEHPVGLRYRTLFGNNFNWKTGGFEDWLNSYNQ
ncbi:MAG: hypothetical protein FJ264_16065 [Planctomycetes bacterium]|nr:hypothetical protein [Planctomycetota bacterium]